MKLDDLKLCKKCGNENLIINFHEQKSLKMDQTLFASSLEKNIMMKSERKLKTVIKLSLNKMHNKKNNYKTDIHFRLIKKTRNRIHHALKGKSKLSSTKEILGFDTDTYRQ